MSLVKQINIIVFWKRKINNWTYSYNLLNMYLPFWNIFSLFSCLRLRFECSRIKISPSLKTKSEANVINITLCNLSIFFLDDDDDDDDDDVDVDDDCFLKMQIQIIDEEETKDSVDPLHWVIKVNHFL